MPAIFFMLLLNANLIPVERLSYTQETIATIGRYKECFDNKLTLYGSGVTFLIKDRSHTQLLFSFTKKKDNIIIEGTFTSPRTVQVSALRKGASDVAQLADRTGKMQPHTDAFYEEAQKALKRARQYQDGELTRAALDLLKQSFEAQKKTGRFQDTLRHLQHLKNMVMATGDTAMAIQEINQALTARKKTWPEAEEFLASMGCLKWNGTWMSRDTFMMQQNFVKSGGQWISAEQDLFRKAIKIILGQIEQKTIYRLRTDGYYHMNAKKGKLVQGMHREEVVLAWGYPEDVSRLKEKGFLFDQWRYGNDYVYLVNGQVALVPPK